MDKTIVMAIWIKQFYGDMDKTIVMAIWIKQLLWRWRYGDKKQLLWRYG